jgi:chemotaxis response regulator CheB
VELEDTNSTEMNQRVPTIAVEMPREHRIALEWDEYACGIMNTIANKRKEIANTTTEIKDSDIKKTIENKRKEITNRSIKEIKDIDIMNTIEDKRKEITNTTKEKAKVFSSCL